MLGHIILNIKDFQVSEIFYDTVLTFLGREEKRTSDEDECKIKSYGYKDEKYTLMIRYDKKNIASDFIRNVGLDHICLQAHSIEVVDELYNIVKGLGVTITRAPRKYPEYTDMYYAFYFRDPSGIPLEIGFIK